MQAFSDNIDLRRQRTNWEKPRVTILLVTYNHEKFLRQALDGILMQTYEKTGEPYPIKIFCIDDASTDNTPNILKEYAKEFPSIFTLHINAANNHQPSMQAYIGQKNVYTPYFCLLEGDDYWTHPLKLDKQIEILDANPQFVGCGHDTWNEFEDDSHRREHFLPHSGTFDVSTMEQAVLLSATFHLSSLVLRNVYNGEPPHYTVSAYTCEATMLMLHTQFGSIYYLRQQPMSVHRMHAHNFYAQRSDEAIWLFHLGGYLHYNRHLRYKYFLLFANAIIKLTSHALEQEKNGACPPFAPKNARILQRARDRYIWALRMREKAIELHKKATFYRHCFKNWWEDTWWELREQYWPSKVTPSHVLSGSAKRPPKLSVMLITYNHEKFIGQALESVLCQKTNFPFIINVMDDCSTDGTQKIVLEYQQRYPDVIYCYFNSRNVGRKATQRNTYRGFRALKGQYWTLLEGDDYWMDEHKLQKQVDFLDAHPEFVGCGHDTWNVYEDAGREPTHFLPFPHTHKCSALHNLIHMWTVFHLSSLVYRNIYGPNPPWYLRDRYSCEVVISWVFGRFGDIYYMNGYMSAHRVHDGGVYHSQPQEYIWLFHLEGFRRFNRYFHYRYFHKFATATFEFCSTVLQDDDEGRCVKLSAAARQRLETAKYRYGLACKGFKIAKVVVRSPKHILPFTLNALYVSQKYIVNIVTFPALYLVKHTRNFGRNIGKIPDFIGIAAVTSVLQPRYSHAIADKLSIFGVLPTIGLARAIRIAYFFLVKCSPRFAIKVARHIELHLPSIRKWRIFVVNFKH